MREGLGRDWIWTGLDRMVCGRGETDGGSARVFEQAVPATLEKRTGGISGMLWRTGGVGGWVSV